MEVQQVTEKAVESDNSTVTITSETSKNLFEKDIDINEDNVYESMQIPDGTTNFFHPYVEKNVNDEGQGCPFKNRQKNKFEELESLIPDEIKEKYERSQKEKVLSNNIMQLYTIPRKFARPVEVIQKIVDNVELKGGSEVVYDYSLYNMLGVKSSITSDGLTKAYRKLSTKIHPGMV